MLVQRVDVPVEVPVEREHLVGEAGHLLQGQLRALQGAQYGPAAGGAEVECDEMLSVHI